VIKKVKQLRIPRTNDAIARSLVLASKGGAIVEMLVSTELQNWHNWASSGSDISGFDAEQDDVSGEGCGVG
jgi:hypothetical protein